MFSSNKRQSMPPSPGKYSLQGLRQVYSDLLTSHAEARAAKATGRPPPVGRKEALIETIRTISEIIIYGEQNVEQELIFDYFCEKNMLALLTDMMKAPWSDELVQTQIIQTVAILVQNVCNETSLYYLLSNNYVNEIISFDLNLQNDDLISHFVSFLKTLSLRLNDRTVQFFLDDRLATFPLYDCVMRFITNVNDSMARTAALTIVLNLFRVEDVGLRAFLLRADKQRQFFKQLGQLFQNHTSQLLGYVLSAAQVVKEASINTSSQQHGSDPRSRFGFDQRDAMDDVIANLQDQLFYLQDLFELDIPSLSERMGDYFVSAFVRPTLLEPIAAWHAAQLEKQEKIDSGADCINEANLDNQSTDDRRVHQAEKNEEKVDFEMESCGSACVALYCLAQVFLAVKDPRVVGALLRDLFGGPESGGSQHHQKPTTVNITKRIIRSSSVTTCEEEAEEEGGGGGGPLKSPASPEGGRRRSESMGSYGSSSSGSGGSKKGNNSNRFSFSNIRPPRPKGTYRAALLACLDPSRKHSPLPLLTCFMLEACVGNPGADPRVLEGLDLAPPRAPKAKKILHSLVAASPSGPITLIPSPDDMSRDGGGPDGGSNDIIDRPSLFEGPNTAVASIQDVLLDPENSSVGSGKLLLEEDVAEPSSGHSSNASSLSSSTHSPNVISVNDHSRHSVSVSRLIGNETAKKLLFSEEGDVQSRNELVSNMNELGVNENFKDTKSVGFGKEDKIKHARNKEGELDSAAATIQAGFIVGRNDDEYDDQEVDRRMNSTITGAPYSSPTTASAIRDAQKVALDANSPPAPPPSSSSSSSSITASNKVPPIPTIGAPIPRIRARSEHYDLGFEGGTRDSHDFRYLSSEPRSSESRRMSDRRATASFSEVELVGTLATLVASACSGHHNPPNSPVLGLVKLASRVLIALHGGGGGGFGPPTPPTTAASAGLTVGLADARLAAANQVTKALSESGIGDSALELMEAEVLRSVAATARHRGLSPPTPDPSPPGSEAYAAHVSSLVYASPSSSFSDTRSSLSPLGGNSTHGRGSTMVSQGPQPTSSWFTATVASAVEQDGFEAPSLSRLSNTCLLLLPHAYPCVDNGNGGRGDDRRGGAVIGGDFGGYDPNDPTSIFRWKIRLFLSVTDVCDALIKIPSQSMNGDLTSSSDNVSSSSTMNVSSPTVVGVRSPSDEVRAFASSEDQRKQFGWFKPLFLSSCLEDVYQGCGSAPPVLESALVRLAGKQVFACVVLDGKRGPKGADSSGSFLGRKNTGKEISQKWFLIDPQLVLIAVPDKQSLNNGRVLTVAPIFSTTAYLDPNTTKRHLTLFFLTDHPIGLADPVTDIPPNFTAQLVNGTRRGQQLPPDAQSKHSSSFSSSSSSSPATPSMFTNSCRWWKLVVLFETEAMCQHAFEHVNSRRVALRSVRRRRLLRAISTAPPATPPAPSSSAFTFGSM